MRETCALILAAGEGTRMRSSLAKVLHLLGGTPMIRHVADLCRQLPLKRTLVVVGSNIYGACNIPAPNADFIAVEVHGPGVGSLLNRISSEGLSNLRVIRHDAAEVLERMIADASLAAVHLFFPDPWPKKRHHKRRLVQAEFAALAARKLAPGGLLHAATDWPDYAEHMNEVLSKEPLLERTQCGFAQRPATKFEARGRRLGHPIRDLYFRRRETARGAR